MIVRPIRRGKSPQKNFAKYQDAKPYLVSRLGAYCSYCERPVSTNLAVEHIQPKKGDYGKPNLAKTWKNFLLACVNCNSIKGAKQVLFTDLFFPDRDNTSISFIYTADGKISVSSSLPVHLTKVAENTLALTGLDRKNVDERDEKGTLVALNRVSQRKEAWLMAKRTQKRILGKPYDNDLREGAIDVAIYVGYFSVWMTVFADDIDMRKRLIKAFDHAGTGNYPGEYGTESSGCFDPVTTEPISPAPNPDNLDDGGKI